MIVFLRQNCAFKKNYSLTPMEYTVKGILQVRILEWVAFPFF